MLTMFLFLLVSCGNRNAGKEQRETTASLEKQGASVETFAADYRPPAGIKYQPTIVRTGAKTINVAAALKHVRALKANEIGTPMLYPTGVEALCIFGSPLLKVENKWVLQAIEGLYLLDDKYKAVRQLVRNDVEMESEDGKNISLNLKPYITIGKRFLIPERDTVRHIAFARDTLPYVPKYPEGTVIDLNQADTASLKRIPGIGSGLARMIVAYRNRLGGFYSVSQLQEIPHQGPQPRHKRE